MAVLLGEIIPSFSGPLQTVTFTYTSPYEAQPASYLPTAKPASPQVYVELGPSPYYGFRVSPDSFAAACKGVPVVYTYMGNYASSSVTLYYEIWQGGVRVASGSGSISANTSVKFYHYQPNFYDASVGTWVEVYLWASAANAVLLSYACIYALPTRLQVKPGYLFKDVTFTTVLRPVLSLGSGSYTVSSIYGVYTTIPPSQLVIVTTLATTITLPLLPTTQQYGLFRAGLGDYNNLTYVTSSSATQVPGCYAPSSVSFRVTPIRA
ncbi:hypothetical protein Desku_1095 [Desulfofundulus kuznetsovii DSM 6115]|uniref:Uncharacterized protein n=1 Tax=Desulfofundulus kuznetsovii (strain DSM 6115 / VKM B-1805 / 17) TaxID=760568 RepID=A0AAU8PM86_DESK7|nr:hypothetical protein Desku_1095 [Desulfofundulus kuznetsovii DSM 6115]